MGLGQVHTRQGHFKTPRGIRKLYHAVRIGVQNNVSYSTRDAHVVF